MDVPPPSLWPFLVGKNPYLPPQHILPRHFLVTGEPALKKWKLFRRSPLPLLAATFLSMDSPRSKKRRVAKLPVEAEAYSN